MDNKLYSVYEAAREAGVTSQWIRTLLAERKLEVAYKQDGQEAKQGDVSSVGTGSERIDWVADSLDGD